MSINAVTLRPGIIADFTPTLNEGGYSASNLIRWKDGLPQKLGGWVNYFGFSLASPIYYMHAWQDLNATNHLAVGTHVSLNVLTGGGSEDITPQIFTSNFSPNFSTTIGSTTVTIVDPNINTVTTFDSIYFNTPISIGGLVLAGAYAISLVTGTTSYQITTRTPATSTVNNAGTLISFTTVNGSATVSVTLANHGLSVGSSINFPISTTVGGLTLDGPYQVVSVSSSSALTVTANNTATSSTTVSMNSGNAEILYFINLGPTAPGVGYGLGGYGAGGYGSGTVVSVQTGTPITASNWSLDNWGQTILAMPLNGGLYSWQPNGGFVNAGIVSTLNAPVFSTGMFVATPAQILVAFGSTTQGNGSGLDSYQDPMLIRWSDIDDYTNWSIDTTNQVGSVRLTRGSAIVGAIQGPSQAFVWTDIGVWSMQYVGQPFIFSFNEIGQGCGLIAQHAMCVLRGAVYWMSQDNFYVVGTGSPQVFPCSVWDVVFQDLNTTYQSACWAWSNALFNEVWFFYPSLQDGASYCTRFVKVNVIDNNWDCGILSRSAGIDQTVLGSPISGTNAGLIYQHEVGNDADGSAINAYIETGYFMIAEGTAASFVDQWFPDMKWGLYGGSQGANVQVTFTAINDLSGTTVVKGPYTVTQATKYVTTRLRGHRVKVRVESNDVGSFWRFGKNRYRAAADGKR